jgi:ABC-type spermidine/putrescine transport system permease subunit II
MENVVILNDHLEYFTGFRYNVWSFGIVCGHLVYFFPFWYVWTKSGNPGLETSLCSSASPVGAEKGADPQPDSENRTPDSGPGQDHPRRPLLM